MYQCTIPISLETPNKNKGKGSLKDKPIYKIKTIKNNKKKTVYLQ
jgi:hypothetical protein